jgi:hypothetical protein
MVAGHAMVNGCGRWARSRAVVRRVVGLQLVLLSTSLSGHLLLPHLLHLHSVTTCDYLRSTSLWPASALIQLRCDGKARVVHRASQCVRCVSVQERVGKGEDKQRVWCTILSSRETVKDEEVRLVAKETNALLSVKFGTVRN